jgi:hypothetical protein
VGVVWVGNPVSRVLRARGYLEVNRVCVRSDLEPHALVHKACSKLYRWAARETGRRGWTRICSYTLESEPGTSLVAAGFQRVALTKGGSWNCPSRPRSDKAPTGRKWRWEKQLKPQSLTRYP